MSSFLDFLTLCVVYRLTLCGAENHGSEIQIQIGGRVPAFVLDAEGAVDKSKSSATRSARAFDFNRCAIPGFAAAIH